MNMPNNIIGNEGAEALAAACQSNNVDLQKLIVRVLSGWVRV